MKESMTVVSKIKKTRFFTWFLTVIILILIMGCEEGQYEGTRMAKATKKVVIFDIEGPDGSEFTRKLATEMNGLGYVIAYGNEYGTAADSISAAKIARDNDAQAFVTGEITQSAAVRDTTYVIHGTFTLHEAVSGDQIGGLTNASYKKDLNIGSGIDKTAAGAGDIFKGIFGDKSKPNMAKYNKEVEQLIESKKPEMLEKLAAKVAWEISKGLGRSW